MAAHKPTAEPIVISFSGVDGAGKSTQIHLLRAYLRQTGWRVQLITFWDDVARLTQVRESAGHAAFKGDKGVGTPSAPVERRDKNVRSPLMTCVRMGLYLLDAVSLRKIFSQTSRAANDVVIFDRYIYDELANLPLQNPFVRLYVRLLLKLVPRPDFACLLDADPERARARKPEYPLDFVYLNRQSYLVLSQMVCGITVLAPMPINEVQQQIRSRLVPKLPSRPSQCSGGEAEPALSQINEPTRLDGPHTHPAAP